MAHFPNLLAPRICAAWAFGPTATPSARPDSEGWHRGARGSRRRQGSGSYRYELTGLAGHAADVRSERGHAGSEFVITTGDQAFLARTAGPASEAETGSRVTAQCALSVVADHEWDAFDLPDPARLVVRFCRDTSGGVARCRCGRSNWGPGTARRCRQVVAPELAGSLDRMQNSLPSGSASVIQPLPSGRR
jgi:hypothetical protein